MLKLSVITPTLNQGAFIEKAIRSVLEQGCESLEYLIVDGGSTDETLDVIRRYDDRIDWWVSEPDKGQTAALAKGIERATGDVIAYLNSDDYYLPGAFAAALGALEGNPSARWVAGAALDLDQYGNPTSFAHWIPQPPTSFERWPRGRHWWVMVPWGVPQPSCFWRRELFEEHGGFRQDMDYAFDLEFMVRLVLAGELPTLMPEQNLSVRVLHERAKSFLHARAPDASPWKDECAMIWRTHRRSLTWRERALKPIALVADPLGGIPGYVERLRVRARFHLRERPLRIAGDLLGHLPESVRPRIRTRDRRPGHPQDR